MKKTLKQFKHLIGLGLVLLLAVSGALLGVLSPAVALALVVLWQLSQFAMSRRCGMAFNTVLTPEQVQEFTESCKGLKGISDLYPGLKDLSGVEGGLAAIKKLPELLKNESKRVDEVKSEMHQLRKAQLALKAAQRSARPGELTEDCARHLGAVALVLGIKGGAIQSTDRYEGLIKDILGMEVKTALTSSDIPLPVEYSGQVAELVGMWGAARKYATVFPLGAGSVKLPRLKTDPTFGLIAGSAAVTEKSPQTEWVTFNAEKFGGLVRLPTELDQDSIVPLGQFLARYASRQLAYVEDYQVFRSTGAGSGLNGTAEGLTKNVVTNSKTTVSTGLGSPSEFTLTHFRTLRTICDAAALRNGAYYLHPSFEQKLSAFNASGDKPYNPQAQILGSGANPMTTGPTLDGFPIRWLDVMPVYTTSDVLSTVHVLFGDVSFQYLGIRGGIRFDTSTEAGFTTDEILVRALERLTTGLMATGAVGGLITAAA